MIDNLERANGQIFNVGNPDNEVSVKELVELMIQVATIAWLEADSVCGSHSVAIPLVLVLPYLFCLNQCLRQYKDTREKTCLLNAGGVGLIQHNRSQYLFV
ncbi:UDP-D-apiose/UDP-D-xylose synthase [Arachis hypogaea]|nr:UDP-D-apiose/UDP-D-xylose synthase [Arachis hypogaea]